MIPDYLLKPEEEAKNLLDGEGPGLMLKQNGESAPMRAIEDFPKETERAKIAREAVMANPFTTKLGTLSAQTGGLLDPLLGGTISTLKYKIYLPSRVLSFKGLITYRDSRKREDFDELVEEILTEIRRFGTITSYKVPHYDFREDELRIESDDETTH